MSSVSTPRARRAAYSASPKSSPTGPTTRTSVKKDADSAKWTAEPPSIRSRAPNGVVTVSNAIDPTTVTLMAGRRVPAGGRHGARDRGARAASTRLTSHARDPDRGVRRARGARAGRRAGARTGRGRGPDPGQPRRDELRRHASAHERLPREL